MALSPIDLCSRALIKLGANSISTFEEGTAEAEVAASLYAPVRDAVLSMHPWNFAIEKESLVPLAVPPLADYDTAFALPSACLRVLSVGAEGKGSGLEYRIIGKEIHTNASKIVVTFVGRPNEIVFPPYFDMLLISWLAAEFCIPLTDSTSRWEGLRRIAEAELRRAKLIDAQEDTPSRLEDFSLIESRY